MKKRILALLVVLAAFLLVGMMLIATHKIKGPVLVSRTDPPRIRLEEYTHDLGSVMEGVEIPFVYHIHNMGGEPLIIKDVSSSCGCTLLNLKSKIIDPGKTGELEAIMDTTMKQGYVKKQIVVISNDPKRPKTELFLMANILPSPEKLKARQDLIQSVETPKPPVTPVNPHAGLTPAGKAKIFTGQCAVCHVQAGKGKMGGELFAADCAMCHGQHAHGTADAPALVPGNYHDPAFLEHLQKTIRYGSDKSITMPGFSEAAGGPLTNTEIDSLIKYLKDLNANSQTKVPSESHYSQ